MFSVSVLDSLIHHDRKYPPDFATAENCVYMQSIHLLAWLLTTCHVVIIVQVGGEESHGQIETNQRAAFGEEKLLNRKNQLESSILLAWLLTTCHVVIIIRVGGETDRKTQIERQTERYTERCTKRYTGRYTGRQTERPMDRQRHRIRDTQRDTGRQTER